MKDEDKTKEMLIDEVKTLRREIEQLRQGDPRDATGGKPRSIFQELHDLFDNANDIIQSVSPNGEFLYVNRKWMETLGYHADEIKELDIFDIVHPDSQEHFRDIFQEIMSGGKAGLVEAYFISKEGRRIAVEGNVNCRFENGEPIATRAIFRDVTEKKKRESQEIIKGGSELLKVAELLQICNFFVPDDSVVTVRNPEGNEGEIYIAKGKILHANTGTLTGKKALYRMLGWEAGVYSIKKKKYGRDPTVDEALEKSLLDGVREVDEFNNLKKGLEKSGMILEIKYSENLMKREYDPVSAEVLSLIIEHKYVNKVLDESKYTDLEVAKAIMGLLQKGIVQAAPQNIGS
jgi:PAS domain S-box-containing protein